MKTAFAAQKLGLRGAVTTIDEAAFATSLRGVPRINSDNLAAEGLSLVFEESLESCKAPRVKPALGFPTRGFTPSSDISEIFHNYSGSGLNAFEDRRGYNVVAIPSEALFAPSKASKMTLGGLRAVGLKATFEEKVSLTDFCHVPITMKAVVGANSRSGNAEVNTDSLAVRDKLYIGQLNDYMKEKIPFAINKIGGCRRAIRRILIIIGKDKGYLQSTARCSHTDDALIPINLKSMQVISGRTESRLRAGYVVTLLERSFSRLQCLGCFSYCLYMQVRDQMGQSSLTGAISKSMQVIRVCIAFLPTNATDTIEGFGKLPHRFMQGVRLFGRRLQYYRCCPIHEIIIPYHKENLHTMGSKCPTPTDAKP